MKVTIDSWFAVATWNWDISDPHCVICMNAFEMPCPQCKYAGEDCAPIQGQCGHHFHMHCIYKWLETHDECPLDRVKWAEKILENQVQP